jgi:pyruvate/2-oxoglutarate dehydrogenase complex dihydrolipoamide dehydrogenase (E3) component
LKDASQTFAQLGVNVSGVELDFATTQKNKETIVGGLVNGITGVVKANGIEVVTGRGRFKDANTIAIEGGEDISFKQAIIATGSHALKPARRRHRRPALRRLDQAARGRAGAGPGRDPGRRRDRRRVRLDPAALRQRG